MIRKTLFWLHLTAGVAAGIVILLLSVTGVLLAFEKQAISFAERDLRASVAETARAPLPLSRIVAAATSATDAKPTNLTVRSDRFAPVAVSFGRELTLFVNPYTAIVLGPGSKRVRAFFEANRNLHRFLLMKGDARDRGKAITGAANLLFLFIVLSGPVIWFPRRRTRRAFRNAALFRRGMQGHAREFNWHHVFGIWAFLPLLAIVVSATVISYPWATQLVYRVFGSTPPPQQQQGGAPGGKLDLAQLDRVWTSARAEVARVAPAWQSVSLRFPFTKEVAVAVDEANGTRPDKRSQLIVDAAAGTFIEHKTYARQEAGQKARAWLRWIHTGEAGGIAGQFVAMLASGSAVMLVYTGLALALRRLTRTLRGVPTPAPMMEEEASR